MDTSSLLEIWDEFTTPDSTALPLDKLVALVRKANPFDEDQARQISLGLFQAIGLNPDTDAIEFAQVENLIHGFSRVEDAAEVTGASAEEDILDFAEDFFTLCGSLDDDPSLGIDQVAVALGDFGFSDAGVEAAITTFEAAVEGASSGAFTADAFFAAAETAEVQGILQQITPAGVDTRSAAQLFDQMDIGGTGTLRKEQFKKLVSTHRDDITDASTLNMVIMEMDSILRDRPDDEDGCNSLGRGAFVSAVREGAFADLLFPPPASLASPRGSGRRSSGSFEKRGSFGRGGSGKFRRSFNRSRTRSHGKSFRHGRLRAESTGDGGKEYSVGIPETNDEMKRVKRKFQIQADKKQSLRQNEIGSLTPISGGSRLSVGGFDSSTPNSGRDLHKTGSFRRRSSIAGAAAGVFSPGGGSGIAREESDMRQQEHEEEFLKKTFKVYSRGNDTISQNDFAAIMLDDSITGDVDRNKSYSRDFIKNLMKELDTNGDGDIDFEEFVGAFNGLQTQTRILKTEGFTGAYLRAYEKEAEQLRDTIAKLEGERKDQARQLQQADLYKDEVERKVIALDKERAEADKMRDSFMAAQRGTVASTQFEEAAKQLEAAELGNKRLRDKLSALRGLFAGAADGSSHVQEDLSDLDLDAVFKQMQEDFERLRAENRAFEEQLHQAEERRQDAARELDSTSQELGVTKADLDESMHRVGLLESATNYEEEFQDTLQKLDDAQGQIAKFEHELSEQHALLESANNELGVAHTKIEKFDKTFASMKDTQASSGSMMKGQLDRANSEMSELTQTAQKAKNEANRATKERDDARAELQVMHLEVSDLKHKVGTLKQRNDDYQDQVSKLGLAAQKTADDQNRAERERGNLGLELDAAEKSLADARQQNSSLQFQLDESAQSSQAGSVDSAARLSVAQSQIAELRLERSNLQAKQAKLEQDGKRALEEKRQLQAEALAFAEKLSSAQSQLQDKERHEQQLQAELRDAKATELELSDRLEQYDADESMHAHKMSQNTTELSALRRDMSEQQAAAAGLKRDLQQSRSELASAKQAHELAVDQIQSLEQTLSTVNQAPLANPIAELLAETEAALAKCQEELRLTRDRVNRDESSVTGELSAMEAELATSRSMSEQLRLELGMAQASLEREAKQRQSAANQMLALQNKNDASLLDQKLHEGEKLRLQDDLLASQDELNQMRLQMERLKQDRQSLHDQLQARPSVMHMQQNDHMEQLLRDEISRCHTALDLAKKAAKQAQDKALALQLQIDTLKDSAVADHVTALRSEVLKLRGELTDSNRCRDIAEQELNDIRRSRGESDDLRFQEYTRAKNANATLRRKLEKSSSCPMLELENAVLRAEHVELQGMLGGADLGHAAMPPPAPRLHKRSRTRALKFECDVRVISSPDAKALGVANARCLLRGHGSGLELVDGNGMKLVSCRASDIAGYGIEHNIVVFEFQQARRQFRLGLASQNPKDVLKYFRKGAR